MAKVYFDKLNALLARLDLKSTRSRELQVKHFFSGAALYVDGSICASWSPGGLAFKLPDQEVAKLIASDTAIALRYFPGGHIKAGYAAFESPDTDDLKQWQMYFLKAIKTIA